MRDALWFLATWSGPVLSILMLAPVIWRPISDRGVGGLSATGTIATATTVQLWLTYGLLTHDNVQVGVNVAVVVVRAAIMLAAVVASREPRTGALAAGTVAAAGLLAFAGATPIGIAATTLSTVNRTPQALHTVRRGRGAGLSVAGFVLGGLSDVAWMIYGIVYSDVFVFGASLICAGFDTLIVLAATRPDHPAVVWLRRSVTPHAEPDFAGLGVVAGD